LRDEVYVAVILRSEGSAVATRERSGSARGQRARLQIRLGGSASDRRSY